MTTAAWTWPMPAHPAADASSFVPTPAPAAARTRPTVSAARLSTLLSVLLHTVAGAAAIAFLLVLHTPAEAASGVQGTAHPAATAVAAGDAGSVRSIAAPRRAERSATVVAVDVARIGARVTAARAALTIAPTEIAVATLRPAPLHRAAG